MEHNKEKLCVFLLKAQKFEMCRLDNNRTCVPRCNVTAIEVEYARNMKSLITIMLFF